MQWFAELRILVLTHRPFPGIRKLFLTFIAICRVMGNILASRNARAISGKTKKI